MSRTLFWILALASLAWIGVVAHLARAGWPAFSMDLSPTDPAVRAAFDRAVTMHVLRYAALALAPPALAFLFARLAGSR